MRPDLDIKRPALSVPMSIAGASACAAVFVASLASLSITRYPAGVAAIAALAALLFGALALHIGFRRDWTFRLSVATAAICFALAMMLCLLGVSLMFSDLKVVPS